ncbi:MAG: hypothetical protein ACFFD4_29445 [Candidatus Odinarchaeota archaeon]
MSDYPSPSPAVRSISLINAFCTGYEDLILHDSFLDLHSGSFAVVAGDKAAFPISTGSGFFLLPIDLDSMDYCIDLMLIEIAFSHHVRKC